MERPPHGLRVGLTEDKGRGVFATRPIAQDELVEHAPVLVVPHDEQKLVHKTVLNDYVFGWGDTIAVVLGYGMLYNHSWQANVAYRKLLDEGLVEFTALRDIAVGEELTINYSSSYPARAALLTHLH